MATELKKKMRTKSGTKSAGSSGNLMMKKIRKKREY